ncbi:hypothetical protein V6615_03965 [Oscillospiraceae bacterium PP1C4]
MIRITTQKDIEDLRNIISKNLYDLLTCHFHTLDKIYCAIEDNPMAQFSLDDYGAIYLVQAYDEIKGKIFESVEKNSLHDIVIYIAQHLSNNEYCADYIIPQSILNNAERNQIEKEL